MAEGMNQHQRAVRTLDETIRRLRSSLPAELSDPPTPAQNAVLNQIQEWSTVRQELQHLKEENCSLRNIIRVDKWNKKQRGDVHIDYLT